MSEDEFQSRVRFRFEVNHRLQFNLLLCDGAPHYVVDGEETSLDLKSSFARLAPGATGGGQGPQGAADAPRLVADGVLQWDIGYEYGDTTRTIFPAGTRLGETFHYRSGSQPVERTGKAAVMEERLIPFPEESGRVIKIGRAGEDKWFPAGEIPRAYRLTDFPMRYKLSLDEDGVVRLHAGDVRYLYANSAAELVTRPGCVYKVPMQPRDSNPGAMRDPFSGEH